MRRRTWLVIGVAALFATACGLGTSAAPTSTPPTAATVAPTVASTATRPPAAAATPTVAAKPTDTPAPESQSDTVWVGNTDGEGVYIRNTPVMADRVRAYPDGTELTIIGDDVDGDGQHWKHVRTPDGLEGYVPAMYTVDVQP
jgi:hypothetical protein